MTSKQKGPSTRSVHAGVARPDRLHAVPTPIVATATYTFANSAEVAAHMTGEHPDPHREEYGRYGNPTVRALEERIAELEGGDTCVAFGSGMAALTTAMLALLKEGIITITSGGTKQSWHVGTGFAEVGPTHVTILVESSTAA